MQSSITILILQVLISASVTYLYHIFAIKNKARLQYLNDQINCFYGPTYALITIYQQCLLSMNSKHDLAKDRLSSLGFPDDINAEQAAKYVNAYENEAISMNDKIYEEILNNFSYIDTEDYGILIEYLTAYLEYKTRLKHNTILNITMFKEQLKFGFLPDNFVQLIISKFNKKTDQLKKQMHINLWSILKSIFQTHRISSENI